MIVTPGVPLTPVAAGIRRGLQEVAAGADALAAGAARDSGAADLTAGLVRVQRGETLTLASIRALQAQDQSIGRLLDVKA